MRVATSTASFIILFGPLLLTGCGSSSNSSPTATITSVQASCSPASILANETANCVATVQGTGAYSPTVNWTATGGTITPAGMFTPAAAGTPTVTATSAQDSTKSGSATVRVLNAAALTVDKFGQGLIADNSGGLNCGTNCSKQYAEGTTVTLTATASSGWKLDHWMGCDAATGSTCTVTMTSDRTVYPTFGTLTTTVKSTVIQLDSGTMALLKDTIGSTLIFDISATSVSLLQPGDTIISLSGNGLARKVRSVTVLPGSSIFVETDDATLEDVIQDGTVIFHERLSSSLVRSAVARLEGARMAVARAGSSSDITIEIDSEIPDSHGNTLRITGSTTLSIEPDFAFHANLLQGITEFRSVMHVADSTSLTVSGTHSQEIDKKYPLYTFNMVPVIVGPVILGPTVTVELTVNGSAEAGLTAGVTYSQTAAVGVHYVKSTGWTGVHDYSRTFEAQPPSLTDTLSFKAGVAIEPAVLIYGVVGPYVDLFARAEAEATATVGVGSSCVDWGLYFGVGAEAGGKVQILSWSLADFSLTLYATRWPLATSSLCAGSSPPSTPSGLTATAVSSSVIQLAWAEPQDNILVAGYHVNRDDARIGTAPTNWFADSKLTPKTRYCYSVDAFDRSNRESGISNVACATTKDDRDTTPPSAPANLTASALSSNAIRLSWSPSSDTNGVAGYTVLRASTPVLNIQTSTADDIGLKPETPYCYQVLAHDEAGNESPPSQQVCATTKSVDGGDGAFKIAYTSNESGTSNIHTLTLDESLGVVSRMQLTNSTTASTNPTWSIDGQTIAYRYGSNEIWTMAADTGGTKEPKITVGLLKWPTVWSVDPRYVYGNNSYAGDGEVAKFDLVNNSLTMLTAVPGYNTQSFSLNSAQSKIAFVRGVEANGWTNRLYTADFVSDGSDFRNQVLLSAASPAPGTPRFSPSGGQIAFIIATPPTYSGVGIVSADGTGFWTPIPITAPNYVGSAAWLDENRLVYSYGTTSSQNLFILDLRDLSRRQITSTSGGKWDIAVYRR